MDRPHATHTFGAVISRAFALVCSRQFLRYLSIGVGANVLDLTLYYVLMNVGFWYLHAQIITGTIGFLVSFFVQRHYTFRRKQHTAQHFMRFCMVDLANNIIITLLLYLLVSQVGLSENIAKIPANGSVVLWNFFLYKFFVYF
jgi:putative flippase GtrA